MKQIDAINAIGEELRKGEQAQTFYGQFSQTWRSMLDSILGLVKRVDFKEKAHLPEDTKVPIKYYLILAIDEICTLAESRNWGLCSRGGFVYIFNGAYWLTIDEEDFKQFLEQAAGKMGIPYLTFKHYKFKNELYEQFVSGASRQMPERGDETLINLKNGTFEITSERQGLREFRQDDFLKYQLPFKYDKDAKCPMFQKFLDEVLPDKDCQAVLSEYLGYIFTKGMKLEKVLMLYGDGSNGKGVVFEVIQALLGRDNMTNFPLHDLTKSESYERANLGNVLLNYATEVNPGAVEASIFKTLASSEPITVRQIYGKPFTLYEYAKLLFNCNKLPVAAEQTHAFFRRFLIIPFNKTIPDEEQDIELAKKIIVTELPGIFNWVLNGLRRLLQQKHFTFSRVVKEQVELYKKESDSVAMFLEDYGYSTSNENYYTLKGMYDEYKSFSIDYGYRAISIQSFSKRLTAKGYTITRKNTGRVVYTERRMDL